MSNKTILLTFILFTLNLTNLKAQTAEKDITTEFFQIFKTDPLKAMDYEFSTNERRVQNLKWDLDIDGELEESANQNRN